ncbi:ABC transporter ATP-binding protein [Lacrimispora indolis]|uniref:ABC transporter ATP-binding protein n=1 Tax=Lacrimispora indolis TaxID=69825 RepID=UPI00045E6051|nr:ABC transporter ATP-binding protein [Lacrimispora indolis]
MSRPLLEVKNLEIQLKISNKGTVKAVDRVSFTLNAGQTLGIVGESGCGKSLTVSSILGLLPQGTGRISGGQILYDGVDLAGLGSRQMREIRGKHISMIFQEPMTSLNPVYTIEKQLTEMLRAHSRITRKQAYEKGLELLGMVGIPAAAERMKAFPHQLSGGMRQRVMIAMAVSSGPRILIADEPTTALDVTIQAQILELMKELNQNLKTSILLITHDMGVIWEIADHVAVMYAGRIIEYAPVKELFTNPLHPYTRGLLRSIPRLDGEIKDLYSIEGTVPPLGDMPKGCRFSGRCPDCMERCKTQEPPPVEEGTHEVSCWKYVNV